MKFMNQIPFTHRDLDQKINTSLNFEGRFRTIANAKYEKIEDTELLEFFYLQNRSQKLHFSEQKMRK